MQRSVTAYFNTRKRQATDDLRGKAKILLLEREQSGAISKKLVTSTSTTAKTAPTIAKSTHSDVSKSEHRRMTPKIARKLFVQEDQRDIRDSFARLKNECEMKNVSFEKKGNLSPRKKGQTVKFDHSSSAAQALRSGRGTLDVKIPDLSLNEIQSRITNSSRLAELKASIERLRAQDQKLDELKGKSENNDKLENVPRIKKFDKIQLEIPVSPQKGHRSPAKTPTKSVKIPEKASSQRRLLFEPKQLTPSPVKGSPSKAPAYQRYLSLTESAPTPALPLPYKYRFLAEAFRCMDTVSAMLYNRGETITFKKLKPAIQELLRRDFTLEHLACIKTIYPEAYSFCQEKMHSFGSLLKQDKYELVLTPTVVIEEDENKSGKDGSDIANVKSNMGPALLLERRRKFFNVLLGRVHDAHEQFLLGLETPMKITRDKIMRWHPEFDVESSCLDIETAELPKTPLIERVSSAKDVLERARSLYNPTMKMADRKGTSNKEDNNVADDASGEKAELETAERFDRNPKDAASDRENLTSLVTPPTTPTTVLSATTIKHDYLATAFKGIPKALLDKVRARQSARALESITRSPMADREASLYSRLPELAKILRNIFVAEKKGVLTIEFVLSRLDNSFRTKLTANELDETIRLLCRLLPTWTCIKNVRKVDYLKLDRDIDLGKILKRLEVLANNKIFPNS